MAFEPKDHQFSTASLTDKENGKKIGVRPKDFEAICVGRSPGISLLPSIPIPIHGQQIGIAQTVLEVVRDSIL
jgi:hypothetical protein